jgi:hypothetical protein
MSEIIHEIDFDSVSFSNGSAEISWNSGSVLGGKFTIFDIPLEYSGTFMTLTAGSDDAGTVVGLSRSGDRYSDISYGSVIFYMYGINPDGSRFPYFGSDTFTATIFIHFEHTYDLIRRETFFNVDFSNGRGEKAWYSRSAD